MLMLIEAVEVLLCVKIILSNINHNINHASRKCLYLREKKKCKIHTKNDEYDRISLKTFIRLQSPPLPAVDNSLIR